MTLVDDASVVAAALVDTGPDGEWAEQILRRTGLWAPHLMPIEVASILRRAVRTGELSASEAAQAHADVVAFPAHLAPYEPFADRVWSLRDNLTAYDAWYAALAEALDAPLATLDQRLASAPGPTCRILTCRV